MTIKTINFLIASIFLLVFAFAVLIGENITEQKSDFGEQETSGSTSSQSEETLIIDLVPKIIHLGFSTGDYRQKIIQEAYDLGGLDFVSLIECENGQWLTGAVGDYGRSHGLCMLNTRWHKEPFSPDWKDWRNQISVCYHKRKTGTKFYGPQRLIGGKRCSKVVKKRFYFL